MVLDGVNTDITNSGTNGDIAFHTHNGEKFRMNEDYSYFSNCDVGIGTTLPTTALTIRKAIASAAYGQQASMIEFKSYFAGYDTETVKSAIYSGVSSQGTLNTQGGYLAFHVNDNGTMGEKMRIENSGDVGIGTTSP